MSATIKLCKSTIIGFGGILLIIIIFIFLRTGPVYGDSPLTSTQFFQHYQNIPEVTLARKTRRAADRVLQYLLGRNPIDGKAAVINSLGWNFNGQENGRLYLKGLAHNKKIKPVDLDFENLSSQELFILGYLLAMDDYFKMKAILPGGKKILGATAIELLSRAANTDPDNFTIHFIFSLVEAQAVMEKSFCIVYIQVNNILKRFPEDKRNMKPEAIKSVMKYIIIYKSDCK